MCYQYRVNEYRKSGHVSIISFSLLTVPYIQFSDVSKNIVTKEMLKSTASSQQWQKEHLKKAKEVKEEKERENSKHELCIKEASATKVEAI